MSVSEGPGNFGEIQIRVRYAETDRMGLLHHANYLVYFEQARTDLLRDLGLTYREMEDKGFLLVLTKVDVKYKSPAYYDDILTVRTRLSRITPIRIEHTYEVLRDGQLLAEGATTLACVDRSGKIQPLPDWFLERRKNQGPKE
ncbi:MAG: acyl-CoA thioesterase [Gemmataceae bacterium]|jgi:acyl-CoA thioester hydrolase|nr:acyl-CoA thioesterase [Gemmataceae bacterium]